MAHRRPRWRCPHVLRATGTVTLLCPALARPICEHDFLSLRQSWVVVLKVGLNAERIGLVPAQLALEDMTQIGLLSAVPGAPTVVGSLVAWNFVAMTMMPAYLIASMIEANVDLGRVHGKSIGVALPKNDGVHNDVEV